MDHRVVRVLGRPQRQHRLHQEPHPEDQEHAAHDGDDPEGPLVGELLEKLLMARLEGLLSTRKDEENCVLRTVEGRQP